jgi:hypothetical protein
LNNLAAAIWQRGCKIGVVNEWPCGKTLVHAIFARFCNSWSRAVSQSKYKAIAAPNAETDLTTQGIFLGPRTRRQIAPCGLFGRPKALFFSTVHGAFSFGKTKRKWGVHSSAAKRHTFCSRPNGRASKELVADR